jgi:hypothetical protein
MGGERTLAHQRFASLSPPATPPGRLYHAMPHKQFNSLFACSNTLVIDPVTLPNVLGAHESESA